MESVSAQIKGAWLSILPSTVFARPARSMAAVAGILALSASAAGGQTLAGPIASVSFSADPDTRWSVAGSLGYRFNRKMALGVELTWNSLKYSLPSDTSSPYVTVSYTNPSRDVVSFTTNVKIELPTRSRITPYAVAGGGISSDTTRYTSTIAFRTSTANASPVETRPETVTSSYLTLVLGGGASVVVNKRLSIDLDLRGFYLRGADFALGRVGVGASYRF